MLINCTLHDAVVYDSKADSLKNDKQDGMRLVCAEPVHLASHLICPEPSVDSAGDDGKKQNHASSCLIAVIRSKCTHVIVELHEPVETVDSACQYAEYDGKCDVSVFDHILSFPGL